MSGVRIGSNLLLELRGGIDKNMRDLPAEGLLGAARLAPPGSPCGRSTSLRDVVEPGLFYVGGSTDELYGDRLLSTIFLLNGAG
jgi:hypothetical protein